MRRGLDLFNHGYFWEAYEDWEGPWRRATRGSPTRLYLQILIRLAAAALKLRMAEANGVQRHAAWCVTSLTVLATGDPCLPAGPRVADLLALSLRLRDGEESLQAPVTPGAPPWLATVLYLHESGT